MKLFSRTMIGAHEVVLALFLTAVLAFAGWRDPSFLSRDVQLGLSSHAVEFGLLALPMTLIIISGGIDLSVGSAMALCSVVFGLLFEAGAPIWLAATGALATGIACGALNGVFIARLGVHPLIVTLATFAAFLGLAEGISLGRPISGFPDSFQAIGTTDILGAPIPLLVFTIAALLAVVFAARTTTGFRAYAIGDNENAARYAALPVVRMKMLLYMLSGGTAALAALLFVARRNTAKADIGTGMELEVITAVVLGGASIQGGRGRMLGTILSVVLIHEVREFVSWRWEWNEVILLIIGVILIVSVLLNNVATRRRD